MSQPAIDRPLPVGTKLSAVPEPGAQVDSGRVVDTYETVTQGVKPYYAKVGDKVYTFNRRPNARMQLKTMRVVAGLQGLDEVTAADLDGIDEALAAIENVVRAMLSDPAEASELLDQLDLESLANLATKAMERLSERPTTGSSASSPSAQPTTSTTGSPAPDSTPQTSTD